MPSEVAKKALDKGLITQKQYSNLNPGGKVRQGKRRKKGKK